MNLEFRIISMFLYTLVWIYRNIRLVYDFLRHISCFLEQSVEWTICIKSKHKMHFKMGFIDSSHFLSSTCSILKCRQESIFLSFQIYKKSFKWIIDKEAKNELQYLFLWLRSQVKTTKRCRIRNSLANLNSLQIPVGRLWERRGNEQIYIKHNIICSINNLSNVSNDVKMVKNVIFNEKILENYQNRCETS